DRRLAAGARPGPTIAGSWATGQVLIAVAVVLAGGLGSPLAAWLALATVTLSARFTTRGVLAGVLFTLALLVGVALAADAGTTLADPPRLIFPALVVVCVALLSTALMRSELEHRSEAAVDGLTGLPNRRAAAARARELAEQSRLSPQPVGLVLADLDRFKAVNDTAGHATGDRVLSEVAGRMRQALGRTGRAYRLSGEEFLVLLPGIGLDGTAAIAERVRRAVRDVPVEGRTVTVSCGVAASRPGAPFDYEVLFAVADAALYDAKRLGRDRVAGGPEPTSARRPAGSAAA
ncbi:MAG TPA: GGDEF domain-containing protein, partial [Solirubrobacteraceae bacterium]|nr:GGDEF domain-containing protein [Solirubrobacteraceae bacterium]